jgi:hypothetical protein
MSMQAAIATGQLWITSLQPVRSEYLDFSVVVAAEALYDKLKEKGL